VRADSLNEILGDLTAEGANYCGMRAALMLQKHNLEEARFWLEQCLAKDPNNEVGKIVANTLSRFDNTNPQGASGP